MNKRTSSLATQIFFKLALPRFSAHALVCTSLLFPIASQGQSHSEYISNQQITSQAIPYQEIPNQLSGLEVSRLVNALPPGGNNQPRDYDSQRHLDQYQLAVDALEAEQGAWGDSLPEQLSGLGKAYQLRGDHREAIEVFERAIHVNRINHGLYDLSQVTIIEDLLDSLIVSRRWEEVHERQQYLYWIHLRNYGASDPRMLSVIDQLGSWYINDYALNPGNRVVGNLVDAYNLFDHATQIIENQYGASDLRMIVPLRGLVLSNWFLWSYAAQNPASMVGNDHFVGEVSPASLSGNPNRLAPYMRNNYSNGKAALDRMIEIYDENPDSPPGAVATAKVELADWHMLSRRWRSATELYQEAYQSLMDDEKTRDHAKKIFERPVALPDLVLMESDAEQYSQRSTQNREGAASYVLVSYNVSRFGEARNIDIIESQPEDDVGIRARVKRSLENTRFRPRIVDGELVDSKGLMQKYLFDQK